MPTASNSPLTLAPVQRIVGDYTFNPSIPGLTRGGEVIHFRPKVARALESLLAKPGVVSRKDLARHIWNVPNASTEQLGNALDQILGTLRRQLGPIKTVELRCEARVGYELVGHGPAAPATRPDSPLQPLSRLLESPLAITRDTTALQTEIVIAGTQPLEVRPEFAQALLGDLEQGAVALMILPHVQARVVPKVLANLLRHGSAADAEILSGEQSAMIEQRLRILRRALRIALVPMPAPVHTRIYHADDTRLAAAVIVPPGKDEFLLYATGAEACDTATSLRLMIPEVADDDFILMNASLLPDPFRTQCLGEFRRYFGVQTLEKDVLTACGFPQHKSRS